MFIKGIAIFLQFILLQSANEIKAKRATLFLLLGHPLFYAGFCNFGMLSLV
jgi:hypothetical protein